ncbi:MAG: sigma-70 family RNA polymerase sigma factor, partial [Bacteroidetes Order II. Incertae sedis bacterium]|nr:sigma-70 family RNA polymerase sigma factor [Bacteroidetes Order II. bacterium]
AALDTLGEPHKSIVILREVQEYKYEEISEVLSLPLNTVKVYLHRSRKALRQELTEVMRHDYA